MTDTAIQFVGDIPRNYDTYMGPHIFVDCARDLATRASALEPSSVLELAAGTGLVSRFLRDRLPATTALLCTDLNEPMLEYANSKFKEDEKIAFQVADAMNLPFEENAFDQVVCQFGVMFFPDKRASYRQVKRILKPGHPYLFNTWGTPNENPFVMIAQNLAEELFPDDPPGYYKVPYSYADPNTVTEDLAAAGLDNIAHEEVHISKEVQSWPAFAKGIVYGNPFGGEVQSRGADPDEIEAMVAERLRNHFGPEPGPMPLKANFFRADS